MLNTSMMLRFIASSRGVFFGIIFFVLIVSGSLLYDRQVRRVSQEELERTHQFLQQITNRKEARLKQQSSRPEYSNMPGDAEEDTPLVSKKVAAEKRSSTNLVGFDDRLFIEETPEIEEAPYGVSPYGFGPYPPLPDDPFWVPETWPARSAEHELMKRVWIKLLSQGIEVKGTTMKKGLVFPIIKGIRYVEWGRYEGPFGTVKYIRRSTGHPEDGRRLRAIRDAKARHESFTEADVPSDIKLIPYEEGGIDPYTFLDLP